MTLSLGMQSNVGMVQSATSGLCTSPLICSTSSLNRLYHPKPSSPIRVLKSTHRSIPWQQLVVYCAEEKVTIEPTTNVNFSSFLEAPGGFSSLSLVGVGKSKDELSKDATFFKAVAEAPVEKGIKIVLVRDVDGGTFWDALDEAIAPRLKAANAGAAGQEALNAFGEVFRGRSLKQGTSVYLTWVQPFKLQVAVSGGSMIPENVEASIVSADLVTSFFDVYLGENSVSPTTKMSIASKLGALL